MMELREDAPKYIGEMKERTGNVHQNLYLAMLDVAGLCVGAVESDLGALLNATGELGDHIQEAVGALSKLDVLLYVTACSYTNDDEPKEDEEEEEIAASEL